MFSLLKKWFLRSSAVVRRTPSELIVSNICCSSSSSVKSMQTNCTFCLITLRFTLSMSILFRKYLYPLIMLDPSSTIGSASFCAATFSNAAWSCLPCKSATSPVSSTKSLSKRSFLPILAHIALKKRMVVVRRCCPSITVRVSDISSHVLPDAICLRMIEPRKYGRLVAVTYSISFKKRSHCSSPQTYAR